MTRAAALFFHQAGRFQDLQVLRNGGTAHRELAGQLADRGRIAAQQADDGLTRGIGQRAQHVPSVAHALR